MSLEVGREGGREGGRDFQGGTRLQVLQSGSYSGGLFVNKGGSDCYTYSNRYVQFFFIYRNVLFMNSNMMHMLPTVHIIK